jgi:hypothetical protein
MEEEMRNRIAIAEERMAKYEINSEPYLMHKEIRDELLMRLPKKLHVADEGICDSCQ